jgi:3-(methylthio)propionyl---CoA ligase
MGGVHYAANPRLPVDQIAYTIEHAGSSVLLYDVHMGEISDQSRPLMPQVHHYIMLTESADDIHIAAEPDTMSWPVIGENAGAFLCYTSGTTDDPKGVLYSHRSVVLHGMAAGLSGASLQALILSEGVTFSGGVPTIWTIYLDHLAKAGENTGTLERVVVGAFHPK